MFNAGSRGKRAKDSTGVISVGEHFNQQQYLVPTVTSFSITDGAYTPLDDTAANTAGGQIVVVNGSGFAPGATVIVGTTTIGSVTYLDSGRLTFTTPALSSGSYTLLVTNANGGTGILLPGLVYSGIPTYTTSAGSLGSVYEANSFTQSVVATGDAPITYSLLSGTLPTGAVLNSANGAITGTSPLDSSSTTYSFTIRASDLQLQDTDRSFTLTINTDPVTWTTPAANATVYTSYEYAAISNVTLSAATSAGKSITYSANVLPGGITLSGNTISGTNNLVGNTYTRLTATAASTGRTNTRDVLFNVAPDIVTWSSPADATAYSLAGGSAMSNVTMSATSAAGQSISYVANNLPAGIAVSGNTIYGTPSTAQTVYTLLTATSAVTNRSATRTVSWTISLGDTYWKYTSLLLNGSTSSNTFINDASLNNNQLTIAGDTKPSLFNPYQNGYYSNYSTGASGAYISVPSASWSTLAGTFTVEFWMNWTTAPAAGSLMGVQSNSGWNLYNDGTTISPNLYGSSNIFTSTFTVASIVLGRWYHVAITRNASNLMTMWINGVSSGSATVATTYTQGAWAIFSPANVNATQGYMSNYRVTNTCLYTTAFTPSTTPLTAVSGTQLLTCQSNRFIDTSTNAATLTAASTISVSPAIPFAASSSYATYGSAYFDGTGDYLSTPDNAAFTLGTNDFTFECWVYPTSITSGNNNILAQWGNGNAWIFRYVAAGRVQFSGAATNVTGTTTAVVVNQWNHVAITRTSGTVRLFVNGVLDATTGTIGALTDGASQVTVGAYSDGTSEYVTGYISNLRLINGTSLYTTTFTPPTSPLTAVANTQLLTCQTNGGATNQGFYDISNFSSNNPVTRVGNASQGTFSPYSATGWSYYLDGTGNFQTSAASTTTMFGGTGLITSSSVITIEGWMYETSRDASPDTRSMFGDFTPSSASNNWGLGTNASGYLCFNYYNGSVQTATSSTTVIPLNTWTHFAVVISSTSLKLFVNGVLQTISGTTTMTGASSTVGYLAAGGWNSNTTNNRYLGYLSNVRVLSGTALYSTTFTPPTSPLTAIANTKLLVAQSSGFVDNGPNNFALTLRNTPSVQSFSPFGAIKQAVPLSYSNYFDGTGDYLSIASNAAFQLGTNSYTFEAWIYPTNLGSNNTNNIINIGTYITGLMIRCAATTGIEIYTNNTQRLLTSTGLTQNAWQHIALVRNGSACTFYVNGSSIGTFTDSSSISPATATVLIGMAAHNSSEFFTGFISNWRLVKGTAVYTSAFTPSTTPLTPVTNTSLLTCQSTTMIDNSTNAFTLTANGDVKPKQFNPFGYTAQSAVSYTPSLHGGSAYFDGAGDYLYNTTALAGKYGTGDFTVEYWVYITVNNGGGFQTHVGRAEDSASLSFGTGGTLYITQTTSVAGGAGATLMSLNQWYHIAWVRIGGTLKGYLNGVQDYSASVATNITTAGWCVGAQASGTYPVGGAYISDVKITNGTGLYTSNFVPPTIPASATATTSLLLSMTGGGIVDAHGSNVLETVGNTQLASEDPYAGSYYSNYFNGSTSYISTPSNIAFAFGTGDFTLECWVYPNTTSYARLFQFSTDSDNLDINTTSAGTVSYYNGSVSTTSAAGLVKTYAWNHIAMVRASGTVTIYVNGTSAVTQASTPNTTTARVLNIGGQANSWLTGYISNLRLVKGTAVYTTTFTPSTSPLTAITNTQLLTCQSNKFIDNSTNPVTLTITGTPLVKTFNPFKQNTGKSLYFDGTGDYCFAPTNSLYAFGTGDFTIEAWIYRTDTGVQRAIVDTRGGSGVGILFYITSNNVLNAFDSTSVYISSTATIPANQWVHVAIARSGTSTKLFINGTVDGSISNDTRNYINGAGGLLIGRQYGSTTNDWNGYIKDLRITKGYARYTANTAPPTATLDIK